MQLNTEQIYMFMIGRVVVVRPPHPLDVDNPTTLEMPLLANPSFK